jgi:hypothetical protein
MTETRIAAINHAFGLESTGRRASRSSLIGSGEYASIFTSKIPLSRKKGGFRFAVISLAFGLETTGRRASRSSMFGSGEYASIFTSIISLSRKTGEFRFAVINLAFDSEKPSLKLGSGRTRNGKPFSSALSNLLRAHPLSRKTGCLLSSASALLDASRASVCSCRFFVQARRVHNPQRLPHALLKTCMQRRDPSQLRIQDDGSKHGVLLWVKHPTLDLAN